MKLKVKMECVCILGNKDLKEYWGTLDPVRVAKAELPSITHALKQPMFKNMKVTVSPILKGGKA